MNRRPLAIGAIALLASGAFIGAGAATAGPGDNNRHGMCTAFFSGEKKGWDRRGYPPPFQALADQAGDYDGDGDQDRDDVRAFCEDTDPKFDR